VAGPTGVEIIRMVQISIRDLSKRFGGQTVLDQVNLDIYPGELFFLLGPSGCGKTTLLRHIAGFYKPDHGRIFFDQNDVTRQPAHLRGTAMMFQSYALWPHLNVAQNVAFGLEERKCPRAEIEQKVAEALDTVRLGGLGPRRITQLSGGQQQRVALARALVVRPHCLLLDEPLSNLDAALRQEMRSEIKRICKEFRLTAIYVTHDREEALSMADRLAVMEKGRLAQLGTPEEVYRNPASVMVAGFIGETNVIHGTVEARSSHGDYEVRTAFNTLRASNSRPDWQPQHGEKVLLSIRPEALTFGLLHDSPNHFPGQIVDLSYLGSTIQYILQMQNGSQIKVNEPNPRVIRPLSGASVRAMALPQDVVMLREG
jgi:iron(III) transport system ATP-binding protein